MPILIALIALVAPRIVFVLLWLFTTFISEAYNTFIWPLLALIFLPLTGLAYALMLTMYGGITGLGWVVIVIAFLIDIGGIGGSRRRRAPAV